MTEATTKIARFESIADRGDSIARVATRQIPMTGGRSRRGYTVECS